MHAVGRDAAAAVSVSLSLSSCLGRQSWRHQTYSTASVLYLEGHGMAQPLMDDNSTQTDPWHRRPPVRRGRLVKEGVTEQLTMQHVNKRLTVWQYLHGSQAIFYAAAESAVVSRHGVLVSRQLQTECVCARLVCVRDVWMHGLLSQQ